MTLRSLVHDILFRTRIGVNKIRLNYKRPEVEEVIEIALYDNQEVRFSRLFSGLADTDQVK